MGTLTEPNSGSGSCPTWIAFVSNLIGSGLGSPAVGQELEEVGAGQHPEGSPIVAHHDGGRGLEAVERHLDRVVALDQRERRGPYPRPGRPGGGGGAGKPGPHAPP